MHQTGFPNIQANFSKLDTPFFKNNLSDIHSCITTRVEVLDQRDPTALGAAAKIEQLMLRQQTRVLQKVDLERPFHRPEVWRPGETVMAGGQLFNVLVFHQTLDAAREGDEGSANQLRQSWTISSSR